MRSRLMSIGALILIGTSVAGCSMSDDEASTSGTTATATTTTATAAASGSSFGDATVAIGTDVPAGDYTATISAECTVRVEGGSLGDIATDGASGQQSGLNIDTTSDGDATVLKISGSGGATIGFVKGTTVTSTGCGTWTVK